jgi:hypothetical protein
MFTDGTIWNWTFDPLRSKAACLSRIKTGCGRFSPGKLTNGQSRMNSAPNPLSETPESLTRDGVPSQSHAAKRLLQTCPHESKRRLGSGRCAKKQPKRTLRILQFRLAKRYVRCLRSNESYR